LNPLLLTFSAARGAPELRGRGLFNSQKKSRDRSEIELPEVFMSTSSRRKLSALILIILFASASLATASVQGTFQRTFQVSGPVDLEVLTRSGDIVIHSGPAGTVSVSGKIHVGDRWLEGNRQNDVNEIEKNPPIRQNGSSIRIEYVNIRNISIDYEITVPADTAVHARSGSGNQEIEGLRSKLDLETGSGDMRLRDVTGDVHVHTGSGNVEGRDVSGPLTAEAGSGDIRLDVKGSGDVRVHTGSGNIELHQVHGSMRAEAGSGDVRVDGAQKGDWDVKTGSGNVELRLPQEAAFDLGASTGSGRVVVGHPVTMTVQGDVQQEQKSVHGKVRGGGPLLTVRTGSGDVHID
jgi:Putative adhesin